MTNAHQTRIAEKNWKRHGGETIADGQSRFRVPQSGFSIGLIGPLQVEILPDGRRVKLLQPFRVRLRELGERIIEAPQGFETDFASVPRFFWRVLPPWGRYSPAAVIHDHLYSTGKVSRADADRAFLTLMQRLGVPAWKRTVMYWAVRLFGGPAYTRGGNESRS